MPSDQKILNTFKYLEDHHVSYPDYNTHSEDIFAKAARMMDIQSTKNHIRDDIKDIENSFDKIHSILQHID